MATDRSAPRFRAQGEHEVGPQQQWQGGFPESGLDGPRPVDGRLRIDSLDRMLPDPEEPLAYIRELVPERDKALEAPRKPRCPELFAAHSI